MVAYYKKGAGNWSGANGWNTLANGTGTDASHPLASDSVCDLNGLAVTLDVDVTVATIQSSNAAGVLTVSGTRAVTGNVSHSTTTATGMVVVGNGTALTLTGSVTESSTGCAVFVSGTGVFNISNAGNTACSLTAGGYCVRYTGTATTCTIAGNMANSSSGNGYVVWASGGTVGITGDVASAAGAGLVVTNSGVINYTGNPSTTATGVAMNASGGTINWTGSSTIAASVDCYITLASGTLALATTSAHLTLTCSGRMSIRKTGGTLTTTATGHTASIIRQTASAQPNCMGDATGIDNIVTGPTLPSAANTWYGSGTFGYAGSLVTPTKRASSIANCSAENIKSGTVIDDVTGTLVGGAVRIGSGLIRRGTI